jgi:hypothetical protein
MALYVLKCCPKRLCNPLVGVAEGCMNWNVVPVHTSIHTLFQQRPLARGLLGLYFCPIP